MANRRLRVLFLTGLMMAGLIGGAVPASATNIGNEGCTPGYWKNHTESWEEYSPSTTLGSVFTLPAYLVALEDDTFLAALSYSGGPTIVDKAKLLLHHAVAAFLNAAHEDVGYPLRRFSDPGMMLATTNSALASADADTIEDLKDTYDANNNLGCPLGNENKVKNK